MKNSFALLAMLIVAMTVSANESTSFFYTDAPKTSGSSINARFVVPVGVETTTGVISFSVLDGKAPLLTDSFVLEPVLKSGNYSTLYLCPIIEASAESFSVELPSSCSAGQYNIYIERNCQRKSYGDIYLSIVRIGEPLPNWFEGELDIHSISTGRGESNWLILPDGTTFLVDAAGSLSKANNTTPSKPNDETTSGQVIVDYINHFTPSVSAGHINYFLLTHHHQDHMGKYDSSLPDHSSGLFKLTSACEVGSKLVMDRIFDRDWPDFSYPTAWKDKMKTNYTAFLDWTASTNGTVIEKWKVGSRTQVVPVNSSKWDVTIRSYAGSGSFWTGGADEETFTLMPTAEEFADGATVPSENCMSCAFILSYGKFDYFNGGDLQSSVTVRVPYQNAEAPLAGVVRKVEVMKADHHAVNGGNTAELLKALAPDVWYVGVWTPDTQPGKNPIRNAIAANPDVDIFLSYLSDWTMGNLGEKNVSHIVGKFGHIVIRVAPGGNSYMVYMLGDDDQEYRVKSIHGPYYCGN